MDTVTSYPVVLGAVGAVSAYMLLSSASSCPQVNFTPATLVTQPEQLDAAVEHVAGNAQRWADTPVVRKLAYLREMIGIAEQIAPQVVSASDKVRHVEDGVFKGVGGVH